MKSVLLYNIYLVNNWREVTKQIFSFIPQDEVFINVNFDLRNINKIPSLYFFLRNYNKVKKVFFSHNTAKLGEVIGMEKFRTRINFEKFDIVTYAHSKGVTKPGHKGVADWREIMRYFVFERFEETRKVFEQGYCLYGCLLTRNLIDGKEIPHERLGVSHWYRGTFVSVNLNKLRNEFLKKEIHKSYLGVEAFFGSLCNFEHCFNAYDVPFSLYLNEYPETLYKDPQAKYFDLL